MKVVETLNDFLKVTTFPYTPSSVEMLGMGTEKGAPFGPPSGGSAPGGGTQQESTTYDTVEDYIAYFNEASQWVTYDSASNTATITGLEGFVTSQKNASKDVGAFDGVDRSKTENIVLGDGENGLHFSSLSREVIAAGQDAYSSLSGWSQDCGVTAYEKDLATVDSVGTDMSIRIDMYDPLYYLTQGSRGRGTFTVEVNLALALERAGVDGVDFATVWDQGHTLAELSGTGEENFIAWVSRQVEVR